jgi:8-oxo-dGTP diphosphatase
MEGGNLEMISYVVGFMFSEYCNEIALIKKKRPEWQKGRLNGIGGHIEKNEVPHDAMYREFEEEAGIERIHSYI